jgi:DNA-directed RNA polymerase subunit RPC12/RpoP
MIDMLEPEKLLQNALTSIRLGVEDFKHSIATVEAGGDPDRAISSARNLYSGLLLLFKYRILLSIKNPADYEQAIFIPPREIIPYPNGQGGILWKPSGKFQKKTIDVEDIKKRFGAFGITVDWTLMEQLREERNHLEHLHPTQTVGTIAVFVADLFPLLGEFITNELDKSPALLLGGTWETMLAHHQFFILEQQGCVLVWNESGISERLKTFTKWIICDDCGSPLVQPDINSYEQYRCVQCDHRSDVFIQLEELLCGELGGYNPFDGDEPPTLDCPECEHRFFVVSEGECYWCDYELEDRECRFCEEPLGLDEQHTDGLCSYHYHVASKDD